MERTSAIWSMCLAIFGRYSLMRMPGTAVGMSLNGPPLTCPGFMSKVSNWLGPPVIHRRMHAFLRFGWAAASFARASNHPETQQLATPADVNRSQSRRENWGERGLEVMVIFLGKDRIGSSRVRQNAGEKLTPRSGERGYGEGSRARQNAG